MTKKRPTKQEQIQKLRDDADRMDESVSSTDGPSSENWVSPERRAHYHQMAYDKRQEADALEREK